MICNKCKQIISDIDTVCPFCGEPVKTNKIIPPSDKITIKDCFINFIVKGFSSEGVATRKEFWIIYIIHVILNILLGVIGLNTINTIFNIIFFFPIMALAIRRYHDTNKSGAWVILGGYAQVGYMFYFMTSENTIKTILLVTSGLCFLLQLFLLSYPTNPKSRWNPINGYM